MSQRDLFAGDEPAIPGLLAVPDTVDAGEEAELIARIDASGLEPFRFGQWRGKRLTANFGSGYDYARGALADALPLPGWLLDLRARVVPLAGRDPERFAQALVIRYDPGAGIGWHRDRPQYDEVIGLSLGAPAMLRLRRKAGERWERRTHPLPARELYLLAGEARAGWQHSIAPMDAARWSVTFRSLR